MYISRLLFEFCVQRLRFSDLVQYLVQSFHLETMTKSFSTFGLLFIA